MLYLNRKTDELVRLDLNGVIAHIIVLEINRRHVKLGIDAPQSVRITRLDPPTC